MDQAIGELNQKIDFLTQQVAFLAEQARINERAREERAELLRDLMPIANDAMRLATEQLQEVQDYVDLRDLLRLSKKLARAAPFIEQVLDQLDGVKDLLAIAVPLTKEAFNKAESVLDDADHKGYFAFVRGGMQIMDNIVTSFGEDDIKQLGENVVLILRTIKEMTQPEIMTFLHNTVTDAGKGAEAPVDISYRALLSQMRDPNVRRGLGLTMRMLRTVGAQAEATPEKK
ncbi:MAG: DUF1641 domain-containing protein [Chloroflexi bacterium]|nr:DUF1641 domain-containing protein [Chloroflexota bacterium]MCL5276053.1 DUF1641 domain-containing protein [Chloroflexota bacterium]